MLEDWQRACIDNNRVKLSDNITLSEELWNHLLQHKIVTNHDRDEIKQDGKTKIGQKGLLLDHLLSRPAEDYDKFCECLESCNQGHIVGKYLKNAANDGGEQQPRPKSPFQAQKSQESLPLKTLKRHGKPVSGQDNVNDVSQSLLPTNKRQPSEDSGAECIVEPSPQGDVDGGNAGAGCYKNNKKCTWIAIVIAVFSVSVVVVAVTLAVTSSAHTFTSNRNIPQTTQHPTMLPGAVKLDIEEACEGNKTLYSLAGARGTDDSQCQSNSGNGFSEDPRSCSKFEFCCQQDSQRGAGSCPEHYTFHPESQTCEFTKKTFYRDPYNCGKYHRCFQDDTSLASRFGYQCNTDLYFTMDTPEPMCTHKEHVSDCIQPATVPTTRQGVD